MNKLRVLSINACSLKSFSKRLEFQNIVDHYKPAIVNVNETHIDDTICSAEILGPGYTIYRKDRDIHGGGVLSAFSNELSVSHEHHLADNYEGTWSKIKIVGSKPLYIGSIYRPPNSNVEPFEALDHTLTHLSQKSLPNVLLTGDFNLPGISWSDDNYTIKSNPPYGMEVNNKMLDIVNDHSLFQHVQHPTRGKSILDLVFTTKPDMVRNVDVVSGMSDHDLVLLDVNLRPSRNKKPPRKVFMFKRGNMDSVRNDLRKAFEDYLSSVAPFKSVQENYLFFKEKIMAVIKDHIPQRTLSSRWNLPWITNPIRRMMRKKQRLYNKAKKTGDVADWQKFKSLRKHIKKQLVIAHNDYVSDLLSFPKDLNLNKPVPTKRFWSYIKSKKTHDVGIAPLKVDKGDVTDSLGKANLLSNQFKSVFTHEDLECTPTVGPSNYPDVTPTVFSVPGIIKLLSNIDPKKANGPDLIPCRILKEAAEVIAPFLQYLYTQSLESGGLPDDWLKANITPVFKKGSKHLPENYRPISLTSVPCKILEHIIFHDIMSHLDFHNILVKFQHGFRRRLSCETQLVTMIEEVAKFLDKANSQISLSWTSLRPLTLYHIRG